MIDFIKNLHGSKPKNYYIFLFVSSAILILSFFISDLLFIFLVGLLAAFLHYKDSTIPIYLLIAWTSVELFFIRDTQILKGQIRYVDEVVLVLLFIVTICTKIIRKEKLVKTEIDFPLFLFGLVSFISIILNRVNLLVGIMGIRAIFQYLLLFYVILNSNFSLDKKRTYSFIRLLVYIGLVQSVIGVFQVLLGIPLPADAHSSNIRLGQELRAFGTMAGPNTLGGYLGIVMVILFSFYACGNYKLFSKKITKVCLIVIFIGLIFTLSRQSILSVLLSVAISIVLVRKKLLSKKVLRGMLISVVVLVLGYFIAINNFSGFQHRSKYTYDLSKNYRVMMLKGGYEAFKASNLFFGAGPGRFGSSAAFYYKSPLHEKYLYPNVPAKVTTVDSNILAVTVENGILGICIYLYLFISLMREVMRKVINPCIRIGNKKPLYEELSFGVLIITTISFYFFMGLTSTAWENHQISCYIWLLLSLSIRYFSSSSDIIQEGKNMRILTVSNMYPTVKRKTFGIFIKAHTDILESKGFENILSVNKMEDKRKFSVILKYCSLLLKTLFKTLFYSYDIIHVHYVFPSALFALPGKFLRNKPLIVTIHGGDINKMAAKNKYIRWLTGFCLNSSDHIIAVSDDLKRKLQDGFAVNERKISIINMGVNTNIFHPKDKAASRKILNLSDNDKIILYAGNLIPDKGIEHLIRAASYFKAENIKCYLVGNYKSIQEYEEFKKLCSTLNVTDKVFFIDAVPQNELALWYSACDVFVLPSLKEGFGLVALEAMACGSPVIASNVGGLKSFIFNNINGILIEPESSHEIYHAVQRILDDEIFAENLVKNAKATVMENSMDKKVDEIICLYNNCLTVNYREGYI